MTTPANTAERMLPERDSRRQFRALLPIIAPLSLIHI